MCSPAVEAESASAGPRWAAWWKALPRARRVELGLLLAVTVGAVAHQAVLDGWYIEDAAISFAYARHLADGEGLVPFPGGERVEGYSNPSWVFLLALFELLGVSAEVSARGLQYVLAAATVPVVYALGREAAPRTPSRVGLLAAATLAASSQFAIWGASGLENALFNFLLAMGLWRVAVEARTGAFAWSAVWFLLVAVTRPEAVLYAAMGGFVSMLAHLHARRGLGPVVRWVAVFAVPFVAWHAWRWSYFAWPLPNTYYAKIGEHRDPQPLHWSGRGWRYVRNWAGTIGAGPLFPIFLLGLTGGRGARPLAAVGAASAVALAVTLPGDQRLLLPALLVSTYAFAWAGARRQGRPSPVVSGAALAVVALVVAAAEVARAWGAESHTQAPEWIVGAAPYALLAVFVLLPLTILGRPGWVARLGCWTTAGVAVFFAVYSNGDWMKGFRWMSLLSVPGAVLFGCGLAALGDIAQEVLGRRTDGWRVAGVAAVAAGFVGWVAPNVVHTDGFNRSRETSPYSVRHRVRYMDAVRDRLHIDERVVALDVDQGAHLWWSDYWMLDIAGLIDVPMAQGRFQREFVAEYLFAEKRPHFAHVHGSWANTSRIPTHREWRDDYVEIPGYPAGRSLHVGNHVRRDLLLVREWEGADPERARAFEGDVELVGWRVPSPEVAAGRRVHLEAGLRTTVRRTAREDFRVVAFLSDGERLVSWDLAPGYDWVPPHRWSTAEIFHGRWSLPVPDDLPPGRYDLGFALLDADGVLVALDRPAEDPRFAVGEVRFDDAVEVLALDDVLAAAEADHHDAIDHATTGDCEAAERSWWLARMHLPRDRAWEGERRASTRRALAECWIARAETDPGAAVHHLERAREWDHRTPRLRAAARPVVDALYAEGLAARDDARWEVAYAAFSDVLRVDPSRAWARRYAEEARAHRFGYDPETRAREEAERQRLRDEAKARAEARIREAEARDRQTDAEAARVIEARERRLDAPAVVPKPVGAVAPVDPPEDGEADGARP